MAARISGEFPQMPIEYDPLPPPSPSSDSSFPWNVISRWRECLFITGMVIAIIGIAIAVFSGSVACGVCFGVALLMATVGLYLIARDTSLPELQEAFGNLTNVNLRLEANQKQLEASNEALRAQVIDLKEQIRRLTEQVNALTLIARELELSAERMKNAVHQFQEGNAEFGENLGELKQFSIRLKTEVSNSTYLRELLREQFLQNQALWDDQVRQASAILDQLHKDLMARNSLIEKFDMLNKVNAQLRSTRVEYTQTLTKLEVTTTALSDIEVKLRQFSEEFRENLDGLADERTSWANERRALAEQQHQIHELYIRALQLKEKATTPLT